MNNSKVSKYGISARGKVPFWRILELIKSSEEFFSKAQAIIYGFYCVIMGIVLDNYNLEIL
jgi:hypothetical protein